MAYVQWYLLILTLNMLGFLENAKIGEIQYLCYGDKCWYLCRSITATFTNIYIIFLSLDLICIHLHMIIGANFLFIYCSYYPSKLNPEDPLIFLYRDHQNLIIEQLDVSV